MTPSERRERLLEWMSRGPRIALTQAELIERSGVYDGQWVMANKAAQCRRDLRALERQGRVRRALTTCVPPLASRWEVVR